MVTFIPRVFGGTIRYTYTPPVPVVVAPKVLINDQAQFVLAGSLQFDSSVGKVGSASFMVRTKTDTHFQQYQDVQINDQNGVLAYSGYITTPKEQKDSFQDGLLHTITCTDQTWLAKKRVIAGTFINKTCGEIVQSIVTNYLAVEGVTIGQIYDGIPPALTLYPSTTLYPGGNIGLIPSATFAYCTIADAFNALAKAASNAGIPYYWMIDYNKKMWFVPYTAVVNSTVIDGSHIDTNMFPPTVIRSNPTYRNTEYLLGGVAQTVTQTEIQVGDGSKAAFTMGFDLASAPTVSINIGAGYVSQSVGLKGTTGSQWYWAQGDPVLTQDSSGTKLRGTPNNDLLKVVYIGQYPSVMIAQNSTQITYQAGIDDTSGIVEVVDTDNTLTSVSNGLSEAGAYLTKYAQQGTMFQGNTLVAGYAAGQLVTVNLPFYGLYNAQMLIESVSASDALDGYNIWYTITAVQGPYDVTWVDFWSKQLIQPQIANSINVGVSQSVVVAASFPMSIAVAMSFTATVFQCPIVNTTLFPGLAVYPC